ncbi:MAG: T9SS type A sorting domain-containing protein, partial [Bacteroidales bacterium]|nr:T9SS type A sorting domain-containing protein [Bacteroidales bacterium]
WINSSRLTYTYNASNKVLTEVKDLWLSGNWTADSRVTNTYEVSGYLTNTLSQIWYGGSSSWVNETQENYTNNADGTPSVIISQEWDGISTWNNSNRFTFTYSSATLNQELSIDTRVIIYPNPTTGLLRINSVEGFSDKARLEVFDYNGRIVLQKYVEDIINQGIDVSQLSKGVYYIRIKNNNINYHQKIVIQ